MRTLYLIPSLLSDRNSLYSIPPDVVEIINDLEQFIVEDIRTARRFLSKIGFKKSLDTLKLKVLNEHTSQDEISTLLEFVMLQNTGILSEAGAPAVADPGSEIVKLAHINNIKVVPLVGPSSILLALMASRLNGQSFAFSGYLPIKKNERIDKLRSIEKRSKIENQTQIFIETPYRNNQILDDILQTCRSMTKLTIAANITGKDEYISTKTIKEWKKSIPEIKKIPTVFLIQA